MSDIAQSEKTLSPACVLQMRVTTILENTMSKTTSID
jgi:hypothetical protein